MKGIPETVIEAEGKPEEVAEFLKKWFGTATERSNPPLVL